MSDTQNKSREELMLQEAEKDGSNKILEDYLTDIKQRFKPENVNQLSTEPTSN